MKKALYTWGTVVAVTIIAFVVLAVTSGKAHAEDDVCPAQVTNTIYVDRIVYVDRPVDHTVYVDRPVNTVHYTQVPVEKIIYVEKPVYETNPETSDPKVVRAMMKVTHDRYLALLAKYRALNKVKR